MNLSNTASAWEYIESGFDLANAGVSESLLAIGNGYIGVRGFLDEGDSVNTSHAAAFLNGVYESMPIEYDEAAYGFAKNCHRITQVPHLEISILIDGVAFAMETGQINRHQRCLAMDKGVLIRKFEWQSPSGKLLDVKIERSVSMQERHLMFARVRVRPLNFSGEVEVIAGLVFSNAENQDSKVDQRTATGIPSDLWFLEDSKVDSGACQMVNLATNSGIRVVTTMLTKNNAESKIENQNISNDGKVSLLQKHGLSGQQGEALIVDIALSYYDSRQDHDIETLSTQGKALCRAVLQQGLEAFFQSQQQYLDEFWQAADIRVETEDGSLDEQIAIRFALFQLLQSTGKDGHSSIAAKGVTGNGYDGHYFWDSEVYVLPFWLFNQPSVAKSLLQYRVNTLSSARQRARELGHETGALYAWRTIGGEECSSYYPAGTAQYHINADIAYAARNYFRATKDIPFFWDGAAEMVLETARIWLSLGTFNDKGEFGIYGVTGPDEYTAVVDNNFYTNRMAQAHLLFALELVEILEQSDASSYQALKHKLELSDRELVAWEQAADKMVFIVNTEKQIMAQDASFLSKPEWDFENTPRSQYPLLLNFHPLVIYRHQVIKQADALLAFFLEGQDDDKELKRRCFDYYEPRTTHDSTLSACVHGIVASEIGYHEQAEAYFSESLMIDLKNKHGNTNHGLHTAALAGVWMSIVQGFFGLRYAQGQLSFKPSLPTHWRNCQFRLRFQNSVIEVQKSEDQTRYTLLEGSDIAFHHNDVVHRLSQSTPTLVL